MITYEPQSGDLVLLRWDPTTTRIARIVRWTRTGKAVVQIERVNAKGERIEGVFGSNRTFERAAILGPFPPAKDDVPAGPPEWGTLKRLDGDAAIRTATELEWRRSVRAYDRDPDDGGGITVDIDGQPTRCYVDGGEHDDSEAY